MHQPRLFNELYPICALLAVIAVVAHAGTQQSEAGERAVAEPSRIALTTCVAGVNDGGPAACGKQPCRPTWCQGCLGPRLCYPDDYCPKASPCLPCLPLKLVCPDYRKKCTPSAPCRVSACLCDDYCAKPCPACPSCTPCKSETIAREAIATPKRVVK